MPSPRAAAIHSRSSPGTLAAVTSFAHVWPPSWDRLTVTLPSVRLATYRLSVPALFLAGAVARSVSPPPGAKPVVPPEVEDPSFGCGNEPYVRPPFVDDQASVPAPSP